MDLPLPIRILLWPLSLIYGMGARLRVLLYEKGIFKTRRLRTPVISVGNLTVGGTGKTPMVIWLASKLVSEGKRVAILTRGYRGKGSTSDEVEVMRKTLGEKITIVVEPDRFEAGRQVESREALDAILLDDGFQHLKLARDINLLLVDASRPLWKEAVLPLGRLREPKSASSRADVVVFTRTSDQTLLQRAIQEFPQMPIFPATTQLKAYRPLASSLIEPSRLGPLPPQPVFAFCGIGNPEAFFADVERWGNVLAGRRSFWDHHKYSSRDVEQLENEAIRVSAKSILTTEKDAANLGELKFRSLPVYTCEIELRLGDEAQFWAAVESKLARVRAEKP